MRLNPDCVRDILFVIEDCEDTIFPNSDARLSRYSEDEVLYHVKQCNDSGLVLEYQSFIDGTCDVSDLSPAGHDLISRIRDDTIWNKIKRKIIASIPALISAAIALVGK